MGWFCPSLAIFACLVLAYALIAHWGWPGHWCCRVRDRCTALVRTGSPRGHARWIGGRRWKVPRRRRVSQRWNWVTGSCTHSICALCTSFFFGPTFTSSQSLVDKHKVESGRNDTTLLHKDGQNDQDRFETQKWGCLFFSADCRRDVRRKMRCRH